MSLRWAALATTLMLGACATARPVLPQHVAAQAAPVELSATPFFAQKRYQCGPAALAMALQASGVNVTPAQLVPRVYLPKRKGSVQAEIIAAAREYQRVPYQIPPQLDALLTELRGGHPVLVFENLGWSFYPVWHYAVVIGYDPRADHILLRSGTTRRKAVATRDFLDNWHKAGDWGLVLLRPGQLPATDAPRHYLKAAVGFEQKAPPAAAEKVYAAATRRWPQQPAAWLGLGNTRYAQHDLAGAQAAYQALLQRKPDNAIGRNNLAQVLTERGCRAAAQRQIKRASKDAPDSLKPALQQTQKAIGAAAPVNASSCPAP